MSLCTRCIECTILKYSVWTSAVSACAATTRLQQTPTKSPANRPPPGAASSWRSSWRRDAL
eukprot:1614727-Pyramimonas_sp.AAC.1